MLINPEIMVLPNLMKRLSIFLVPLCLFIFLGLLAGSNSFRANPEALALAITIDLLLVVPFLYFMSIRKTNIPKTTVVPLIFIGLIIGFTVIPSQNQAYLNLFKIWALPIIELSVITYVVIKVVKVIKKYKSIENRCNDFYSALKLTCKEILPNSAAEFVVTEIAVFYYGFIYWQKRNLASNEFSYHKNSGTIALLAAIIFLVAIETVTFHILLSKWNGNVSWIFTGLSIYSGIQLFGFLKSMLKRPFLLDVDSLYLRYGIMSETQILLADIKEIEISSKEIKEIEGARKLSIFGELEEHNLIISLKRQNTWSGLYGFKKNYTILALYIDEPKKFMMDIEKTILKKTKNEI